MIRRFCFLFFVAVAAAAAQDPWTAVPEILARIRPPQFPARDFVVEAKRGSDASEAIANAIDACARAGGGRVVIPPGDYVTGPIHLRSRVNLHVEGTLRFTTDPSRYPIVPTRFEGVEVMNFSPLVDCFECEDVAITGSGTLDGQADHRHWWNWKNPTADRKALFAMNAEQVPLAQRVFGLGHFLRPSFIEPYRCKNVLIEGITLRNAPMWALHPTLSTNVTIRRVTVIGHGPNTDGADPESCRDVLIEECIFDTGDDCIALKSGRNHDGRRLNVPIENVVIRNCRMKAGHAGIAVGSEVSGGARNIFAERNGIDGVERGLRIKTNSARGGAIDGVYLRDIEIGRVELAPIEIDLRYDPSESGTFIPSVRNIEIERMRSQRSRHALSIRALDQPALQVVVRNSTFHTVERGYAIEGTVDLALIDVRTESDGARTDGRNRAIGD